MILHILNYVFNISVVSGYGKYDEKDWGEDKIMTFIFDHPLWASIREPIDLGPQLSKFDFDKI